MSLEESNQISSLVARGALFVINHSGGKDSQAMTSYLRRLIPAAQILVIHAELPGAEWEGTREHAEYSSQGLSFVTCKAGKTFLGMVEQRGFWPSPKYRQCTSDLKRAPIEKAIRHTLKARGLSLIVNCMGLRAEESCSRSKLETLKLNKRNSVAGREWYDWLPVHSWSLSDVWLEIKKSGQQPHWAYAKGMTRLSCVFCIMGSQSDLRIAAEHNPAMLAQYTALERKIGQTFLMPKKGQAVWLDEAARQ